MYEIDFSILIASLKEILQGIKYTVFICAVSSFLAFCIGSLIFFFRWTKNKFFKVLSASIVEVIRNIPLLIILYFFYKGLPHTGITFSSVTCGILALSIYTGVYISENLRAGANSIQSEQRNAALALGMNEFQAFIYVIYPQTLRNVIIPLSSQFMNLIKNSTLVSFIAVTDIFYVVFHGMSEYFRVMEFMILGICLYGFMTLCVSAVSNFIDYKLKLKTSGGLQ